MGQTNIDGIKRMDEEGMTPQSTSNKDISNFIIPYCYSSIREDNIAVSVIISPR